MEKHASRCQTKLIQQWELRKHIWATRNKVINRKLDDLVISKDLKLLQEQAAEHFKQYTEDPHYVTASMNNLFNRPLLTIQSLEHDSLYCWIETVQSVTTWIRNGEPEISKDSFH